jgi:hypothetical protein
MHPTITSADGTRIAVFESLRGCSITVTQYTWADSAVENGLTRSYVEWTGSRQCEVTDAEEYLKVLAAAIEIANDWNKDTGKELSI